DFMLPNASRQVMSRHFVKLAVKIVSADDDGLRAPHLLIQVREAKATFAGLIATILLLDDDRVDGNALVFFLGRVAGEVHHEELKRQRDLRSREAETLGGVH